MSRTPSSEDLRRAKNITFRLVKFRMRSEHELRAKLSAKNLAAPVINQTIDSCLDAGLIDDRQFALQWIASRLKKPFGISRIRSELKEKGISDALIENTLRQSTHNYDESQAAAALVKNRARQYRGLDPQTTKRRMYEYLRRRGFSTNTAIKSLVNL